jgi:hypothetical protein
MDCGVIQGNLEVAGKVLTNLDGLEGIYEVTGDLYINRTEKLQNLGGLVGIRRIGQNLVLAGNLVLESAAFPQLKKVAEKLILQDDQALPTWKLPFLEQVGGVDLHNNEMLLDVEMNDLKQADSISIYDNGVLETTYGFPALTQLNSLEIRNNPKLPQCEVDALDARLSACGGLCMGNDASGVCK